MDKETEDNLQDYKIKIVKDTNKKSDICDMILRNLPEWFGVEAAIKEYVNGVKEQTFIAAYISNKPIGFLSIKEPNKYTSQIYVLGILKEFHRRGIGKKLVKKAIDLLNKDKKFLTVKTLGESHPDEYYQLTRKFYENIGFYPLEEIMEIWGKENPCLFMVKVLN